MMSTTNSPPLDAAKQRLIARLRELDHRLAVIEEDLDQTPNPDLEDRATEREDDEVLEQLGEAGLVEIRQIQAALRRIKEGDYGVCVACGNDISVERLNVLPATPRCRHCA